MPKPDDELLSPTDLHRKVRKFGLAFQRNHRKAGDFPIPHVQIGSRSFYRRSSVEKFLAEQEAQTMAPVAQAPAPEDTKDTLAETLAKIIRTTPTGEETRQRIAELLGGGDDAA
jgi:hypothetical protein